MQSMPLSANLGLRTLIPFPCGISVTYVYQRLRQSLELCFGAAKNKTPLIAHSVITRNSPTSTRININHL